MRTISDMLNSRRSSSLNDSKMTQLPVDFQPTCYSVICGRGGACFNSVGNRRFRVIVAMFLERYSEANTKLAKSKIVSEIINIIQSAGGGFVKQENGLWYEVSEGVAREKVGALFRDCLHTQYRSSAKSKLARRKARQANGSCFDEEEDSSSHGSIIDEDENLLDPDHPLVDDFSKDEANHQDACLSFPMDALPSAPGVAPENAVAARSA